MPKVKAHNWKPRLRSVDEMRKEDLRRSIAYCKKWGSDPRVSADHAQQLRLKAAGYEGELALLEAMPDSAYART